MLFEDLPLSEDVLDAIYDMRFETCTPIQEEAIPPILDGRDLIGIAQTGTGKTAAYLLPLLTLLQQEPHPEDSVNCLIMAPTRELAQQIDKALQGFAYYMDINGVAVYGGNDGIRFEQERRSLQRGADIIIATPGRLISHIELGKCDLSRTTHLILDEADRMLDMGFSADILKIVEQMPKKRQTILFSATMPPDINRFARSITKDPVEIHIAVSKPAEKIQQKVYVCFDTQKTKLVHHILSTHSSKRVIIFAGSKLRVKELNISLKRDGFNIEAMHSDLEQKERDQIMLDFKSGKTDILVATDIVSRGIDIDDITMVINYDVPHDAEDYVHRIGRTARAGREGCAFTLVGEKEMQALKNIERMMEMEVPREALLEGMQVPTTEDYKVAKRTSHHKGKQDGGRYRNKKNTQKGRKATPDDKAKSQHRHSSKPRHSKKTQTPQS